MSLAVTNRCGQAVALLAPSILLRLLLLGSPRVCADQTVTPRATGRGVVTAVVGRIEASCVFPDDKLLGRRIAWVASSNGNNPDTFRGGYYGGIWQVDELMFNETKRSSSGSLLNQTASIREAFGIDWMAVTWQDLTKPLYSALAARLFIHSRGAVIPRDVDGQATFYVTHYRKGSSMDYLKERSSSLDTGCRRSNGADIVFLLDGSGSIGSSNFDLIRSFVKSAIDSFDVGPGPQQARIGLVQFSNSATHVFNLTTYATKGELKDAVDRMKYLDEGTRTDLGLDAMTFAAFSSDRGARPLGEGHPRVGIVVTDGMSDNPTLTLAAARRAHAADITLLAVGVAGAVDAELRGIASQPVCLHVIMLNGFNEFSSLHDITDKRTCDAPIIISIDQGSHSALAPGQDQNCKIKIPSEGATIRISTSSGNASFFVAGSTYPSPDFFDQVVQSFPDEPGVIFVEVSSNSEGVMYCNIQGSAVNTTTFRVEAQTGNSHHCQSSPCRAGTERCVDAGSTYLCKAVNGGGNPPPFHGGGNKSPFHPNTLLLGLLFATVSSLLLSGS